MPLRTSWLGGLLAAQLFAVGCGGSRITRENCQKIRTGMSRGEVEQILGPSTQSYQGIVTWKGSTPEQRITIVFDEERRVSEKTCEGFRSP